jgi:hypothetical protein
MGLLIRNPENDIPRRIYLTNPSLIIRLTATLCQKEDSDAYKLSNPQLPTRNLTVFDRCISQTNRLAK